MVNLVKFKEFSLSESFLKKHAEKIVEIVCPHTRRYQISIFSTMKDYREALEKEADYPFFVEKEDELLLSLYGKPFDTDNDDEHDAFIEWADNNPLPDDERYSLLAESRYNDYNSVHVGTLEEVLNSIQRGRHNVPCQETLLREFCESL